MQDFITWLALFSAKTALLLGAAAVAAALARKRSPATRHCVWAVFVVASLLAPLAGFAFSALPSTSTLAGIQAEAASAGMAAFAPIEDAVDDVALGPSVVVVALWGAGVAVSLLRLVRSHVRARRLVRASTPMVLAVDDVAHALSAARCTRRVEMSATTEAAPMTVGVVSARVLLPRDAPSWTSEELRAVLIHELAHVVRRDNAIQALAELLRCLQWFNPLASIAVARLRAERELACDDVVVASGVQASLYADLIVKLARRLSQSPPIARSAACAADPSGVEARVRRMLGVPMRAPATRTLWLVALVATAAALTFATAPLAAWRPLMGEGDEAAAMVRAAPDMRACFGDFATEDRELVLHWSVDDAGRAPESCVTKDTLHDDAARNCVMKALERANFPAALRGQRVVASFPSFRVRVLRGAEIADDDQFNIPIAISRP